MGPIDSLRNRAELLRLDLRGVAGNTGSVACQRAAGFLFQAIQELDGEMPETGTILPNLGGEIDTTWTGRQPMPSASDLPIYPTKDDLGMSGRRPMPEVVS